MRIKETVKTVTHKTNQSPLSNTQRLSKRIFKMEWLGVIGFILGLAAYVRVQKLIETLKATGVLDSDYKER